VHLGFPDEPFPETPERSPEPFTTWLP
jgi:hypothetical protein